MLLSHWVYMAKPLCEIKLNHIPRAMVLQSQAPPSLPYGSHLLMSQLSADQGTKGPATGQKAHRLRMTGAPGDCSLRQAGQV